MFTRLVENEWNLKSNMLGKLLPMQAHWEFPIFFIYIFLHVNNY